MTSSSSASDLDGAPDFVGGGNICDGGGGGSGYYGSNPSRRRRRVSLDRDSARHLLRSVVTFCPPNNQR